MYTLDDEGLCEKKKAVDCIEKAVRHAKSHKGKEYD
jgi:hypothetical protein